MELKNYQSRVLSEVQKFLEALAAEQSHTGTRHAASDAWRALGKTGYREDRTGDDQDLPSFCIKVPTGGGKTLLATQILGQAHRTLLPERNGAGLVLWVVPSDQIYQDTLKAFRDRKHFYRESLEFSVARRVQIWEKHDILRMTPSQLSSDLNILLLKLQGTSRQDKETLKFFRDSGGNIVQHFPPEDSSEEHRVLLQHTPNLDMLVADEDQGQFLARTSLANLVRLCRPVVILDEKQRAVSQLARDTIRQFNPALVVELSATPPEKFVNELCSVSGQDLLNEQMIKLPINVATSGQKSWQMCLSQAYTKRSALAAKAYEHAAAGKPLIRPIVLVQVERVGKDQRDTHWIHSEQVREYLIQNLGIDSRNVRVKTGEKNEIEKDDLMSPECTVEWIITKSALQEGWDCPFAYILVSLANAHSKMAMTQLVGRVLRQPFVEKTPYPELNESYVYCLHRHASEVIHEIRNALHLAGYEGNTSSVVDVSQEAGKSRGPRLVSIRPQFSDNYLAPFHGKILLPRFCVRAGDEYEPLDYFRHLISQLDLDQIRYDGVLEWDLAADLRQARDQFWRVGFHDDALEPIHIRDERLSFVETDAQTCAWLVANIDASWFSAKFLRRFVQQVVARLPHLAGSLALVRFPLLERMQALLQHDTDRQTEQFFEAMFAAKEICFYMDRRDCVFSLPSPVSKRYGPPLRRLDYSDLQRPLYDHVPEEEMGSNQLELDFLYEMDEDEDVLWWHRNAVGEFAIQGWRRSPIYPDFIAQLGREGKARPQFLIVETKGTHLDGNNDTRYKRAVADKFSLVGNRITWQMLVDGAVEHSFCFKVLSPEEHLDHVVREHWEQMKSSLPTGIVPAVQAVAFMK